MSDARMLHLIVNPVAGNGRAGKRWRAFAAHLEAQGFATTPHLTTGPGHATELARQLAASDAGTIVCVGGDGTLNEVVNGLLHDDRPVNPATRLAVIPCGTGKDMGRTLGTRDVEQTARALAEGTVALIDVGRLRYVDARTGHLETRYFANVADTGIGAATAQRINATSKRFGGLVSYLTGAVQSIAAFQPWDATVEVDGRPAYTGSVGMVVVANARYFGGGMLVAPDASLCDGLLDVFILEGVGKRALLTSLLPRVYRGKHVGRDGVRHQLAASVTVRSEAGMLLEMDGEQLGSTPVSVTVVPRVLTVVARSAALARAGSCTGPCE